MGTRPANYQNRSLSIADKYRPGNLRADIARATLAPLLDLQSEQIIRNTCAVADHEWSAPASVKTRINSRKIVI